MKTINYLILLILIGGIGFITGCGDDESEPVPLTLESLEAGSVDLNGASSAVDVPTDAAIVATFSTDVDESTVQGNITMTRNYDDSEVQLTISVSGSTVTITPSDIISGALYEISFSASIASTEGLTLTALTRTFTTAGTFVPGGQVAHWNFEGNANDQVGSFNATGEVGITYTAGRSTAAGTAATFDGDVSIIEIPNGDDLMDTQSFTMSFWVKTNSTDHVNENGDPTGHFVIGLGAFFGFQFEIGGGYDFCKMPMWYQYADGTGGTGGDLFWNGDRLTKDNGGWQGTTFNDEESDVPALLKDTWAHIVYVYDASANTRTMFINGEKRVSQDHNLWPEGDPVTTIQKPLYGGAEPDVVNELAFGFIQSRAGTLWDAEPWGGYDFTTSQHFKGQLDDIRIFHVALSDQEVSLVYNSEKP